MQYLLNLSLQQWSETLYYYPHVTEKKEQRREISVEANCIFQKWPQQYLQSHMFFPEPYHSLSKGTVYFSFL